MSTEVASVSTKHRQAREAIGAWIRDNKLAPGDRLPSVRELMDILRVSYSTLSRALNDMREAGLIEQSWGKGIFLREAKTELRNIAVTFNEMVSSKHPHVVKMLEGIGTAVASHDWQIQLFPLPDGSIFSSNRKLLLQDLLQEKRIQAVISLSPQPPEDIDRLHSLGIHVVSVAHEYPGSGTGSVIADCANAARRLAAHLVGELGHRRVHMVLGPKTGRSARMIRQSTWFEACMTRELKAQGVRCPPSYILHCNYEWAEAVEPLRTWLTGRNRPTAIVFADEAMALAAMELAKTLGLEVPRDLSIATSSSSSPSSTTSIVLDLERMGALAVAQLDAQARGGEPVHELAPANFHAGATTAAASPASDPKLITGETP